MKTHKTSVLAIGLLLAAAGSAPGQYELDNNLQVGSGGINQPQQQQNYNTGNNIVTGNVTGLDYFHGNVGYRAPGEFTGQTGSNDLFRFRAQSAPMNPAALNQGQYHAGRAPIYREQSGVSGADVTQSGLGGASYIQPHSRAYRQYDPTLAPGAAPTYSATAPDSRVMLLPSEDGNLYEVYATPMLGMRSRVIGRVPQTPGVATDLDAKQQVQPGREEKPAADVNVDSLDFDFNFLNEGQPSEKPKDPADARVDAAMPSTRVTPIGPRVFNLIQSSRINPDNQRPLNDRIAEIEAQLYSPLGSHTYQPGQDVYLDLLERMRKRGQVEQTAGSTNVNIEAPTDTGTTTPRVALESPTPQAMAEAEAQRIAAMREALGLPPLPETEDAEDGDETDGEDHLDAALRQMLSNLEKQGPALRSLAGAAEADYNSQMRQGEKALLAGKYFEAEARFIAAAVSAPDQPLPRIGQVHAQMGAGLVRTAATNLRHVLTDHPELIATQYLPTLLPDEQRLVWLRERLEEMIGLAPTPEAALLMAYLGYQTGNRDLTVFGLDKAQAASPTDPLWPVLRRIWIK